MLWQWLELFLPCNEMPVGGHACFPETCWLIALVYRGMISDVTLYALHSSIQHMIGGDRR